MNPVPDSLSGKLRAIGRCDDSDPRKLRFAWSGSGFEVRFLGTALHARVAGSRSWVLVEVDGRSQRLELLPGTEILEIGRNLSNGEHRISVRKSNEPLVGELVLSGLETDGKWLPPVAKEGIRVLFVGDSITCGYGNLAPDETHGFDPATEDCFQSYAGVVECLLDADVHCVAWSGLGIVRNFDPEPGPTLVDRYGFSSPISEHRWDPSRWSPQVVVVNLGSNDLYRVPHPDPVLFQSAWIALIERLSSDSPGAKVVLLDGPLVKDGFPLDDRDRPLDSLTFLRSQLDAAASRFDPNQVFRFSLTTVHPDRGWGADWHPSLRQHLLNGRELTEFLRSRVVPLVQP